MDNLEGLYRTSWQDPHRHIDETGATNDALASTYIAQLTRSIGRNDLRGLRILDYGAGRGAMLEALLDSGVDACGIDPYGYRFLQSKGFAAYHSLEELPLGTTFDGVISIDVVEHMQNPCADLSALRNVLPRSGWIFISTPNAAGIKARLFRDRWTEVYNRSHMFFFTPETLRLVLRRSGFLDAERLRWSINYRRNFAVSILHRFLQLTRTDGELRFLGYT
jgi:2-polyprenyl-3-methyl-5-hydroxy-6-metoxy-1,4-benzoquinol methylase